MSEKEESSSDESTTDTISLLHTMQDMMKSMIGEVDESLDSLRHLYTEVHHSQDLFTHLHIQEKLQPYFKRWANEKRLSENGLFVELNETEQKEFQISTSKTNIYTICEKLIFQIMKDK